MGDPYVLPPLPSGGKLPFTGFSVRVKIRGHASSRWKGSKDTLDSIKRNQVLSEQRAKSVCAVVEQQLKRDLGSIPFNVESKGDGIWAAPDKFKPDDNEPITRSVTVTMHLIAKTYQGKMVKRPPRRIPARTRSWYLRVQSLDMIGVGYANFDVRLTLRNALSKKEMTYVGTLHGGGIVINPFDLLKRVSSWDARRPAKRFVGEEVHFETNREMGFRDFDKQFVAIGTIVGKLGGGARYTYLSFNSLGSDAELLAFDHGYGVGMPKLNAARGAGKIHMIGAYQGDDIEEPRDDVEMVEVHEKDFTEGVVVTFPTGKSAFNQVPATERQRLTEFLTKWANYASLLRQAQGP